jgi:hypothetical protein
VVDARNWKGASLRGDNARAIAHGGEFSVAVVPARDVSTRIPARILGLHVVVDDMTDVRARLLDFEWHANC